MAIDAPCDTCQSTLGSCRTSRRTTNARNHASNSSHVHRLGGESLAPQPTPPLRHTPTLGQRQPHTSMRTLHHDPKSLDASWAQGPCRNNTTDSYGEPGVADATAGRRPSITGAAWHPSRASRNEKGQQAEETGGPPGARWPTNWLLPPPLRRTLAPP